MLLITSMSNVPHSRISDLTCSPHSRKISRSSAKSCFLFVFSWQLASWFRRSFIHGETCTSFSCSPASPGHWCWLRPFGLCVSSLQRSLGQTTTAVQILQIMHRQKLLWTYLVARMPSSVAGTLCFRRTQYLSSCARSFGTSNSESISKIKCRNHSHFPKGFGVIIQSLILEENWFFWMHVSNLTDPFLLRYCPFKWVRRVVWLLVFFFGLLVVAARKHYSLDIMVAWYTVPLIWIAYDHYFPDKLPVDFDPYPELPQKFRVDRKFKVWHKIINATRFQVAVYLDAHIVNCSMLWLWSSL